MQRRADDAHVIRVVIGRGAARDTPHDGIGKPEALRPGLHGYGSRRITDQHPQGRTSCRSYL